MHIGYAVYVPQRHEYNAPHKDPHSHVCTCERDPDSFVKALQPLVTLTGTVG